MQRHKDTEPLMKNRLFKGIDSSKFKMKLRQNNFLSYREGDMIFQKGDPGENMYLILEGEVKLKMHSAENGTNIFRKGRNDFFGEAELFDKVPRSSSAIANTDCILYTLPRKEIYELISANKLIKKNINGEEIEPAEPEAEDNTFSGESADEEINTGMNTDEVNEYSDLQEEASGMSEENLDVRENELEPAVSDLNPDETSETPVNEYENGITLTGLNDEEPEITINEQSPDEDSEDFLNENTEEDFYSNETEPDIQAGEEILNEVNQFEMGNGINDDDSAENLFEEPQIEMPETDLPETGVSIDYQKLFQAVRKIYSGNDLEGIVRSTIEALIDVFDAQIIRVFISENHAEGLWSYPFMDNSEEIKKVKLGEGLVGSSAISREVINLNEPMSDARFNTQVDSVENILIEDMILFPVLNAGEKLTAVVQMINSGKNGFTNEDVEMLSLLSPDISNAIEKANGSLESAAGKKPEQQTEADVKTLEDEYTYFSKTSEFLTGDIKIASSLLLRYLDFIRKKSEVNEIKNVSGLALLQSEIILKDAVVVADFINGTSALKKEITGIRKALDDTLEMLAEYVELRKVKLFKKCLTDASVNIDKQAFYIACFQVVKNSCEAMPQGGSIYVTCEKAENELLIEIKDSGKGISEDIRGKIFEPFFSFPEGKPGLGLSVARKIIKDHGGELNMNPESIEGTSFVISLPIVE